MNRTLIKLLIILFCLALQGCLVDLYHHDQAPYLCYDDRDCPVGSYCADNGACYEHFDYYYCYSDYDCPWDSYCGYDGYCYDFH